MYRFKRHSLPYVRICVLFDQSKMHNMYQPNWLIYLSWSQYAVYRELFLSISFCIHHVLLKPLSQLTHGHFGTPFDWNFFGIAQSIAYVKRDHAFVACVFMVASSLLKIVDMQTIQTRPNAIKIIAMQRTNIRTTFYNVLCTRESDARFLKILK